MSSDSIKAYQDYYNDDKPDVWMDRYLWVIENFIGNVTDQSILEIGCGAGGVIQCLQATNRVYGIDASESGVEIVRHKGVNAEVLDVSMAPLPFGDQDIDLIICLETFEHLSNPQYAIDEIKRVLKPGGKFVGSIPNPLIGHPYLYPGLFTYKNFCRFLRQNGFSIQKKLGYGRSPFYARLPRLLRLPLRVFITVSEKLGFFPYYLYWLWTFTARYEQPSEEHDMVLKQAKATKPAR